MFFCNVVQFRTVVKDGKILKDWSKSWLVKVYKGRGDGLTCSPCPIQRHKVA